MRIEVLVDVKTILARAALDVAEQRLYWIDSFGMNVFRCTHDGREIRAWDVPQKIGSMALRKQGGAVLSLARGFHFLDFKTGEVELIVDPEPDKPNNRINDGKVDKRAVRRRLDGYDGGGRTVRSTGSTRTSRCTSSTTRSSSRTARAGAPTAASSISPTPGRARSGLTTMISIAERSPTDAPSPQSIRLARRRRRIDGRCRRVSVECPGL